jgi:hypothetical protein
MGAIFRAQSFPGPWPVALGENAVNEAVNK